MFPKEGGPAFSISAYSSLISRLPKNKSTAQKSFLAGEWDTAIKNMWATEKDGDDSVIPLKDIGKAQDMLNKAAILYKEYENDPIGLNKQLEELIRPAKANKSKGFLRSLFFIPPGTKELREMGYKGSIKKMVEDYKRDNGVGGIDMFNIWEWGVASMGGTPGLTTRAIHIAAEMDKKQMQEASRKGEVILIAEGEHTILPSGAAYQIKGREDEGVFIKR